MKNKELSTTWKILCGIATAITIFGCCLIATLIAEFFNSESRSFVYGGFLIGIGSYGIYKEFVLRYILKVNPDETSCNVNEQDQKKQKVFEQIETNNVEKLTHILKKSTCENHDVWNYYIHFVKDAIGEKEFYEKIAQVGSDRNVSRELAIELFCSEYAATKIYNDREWAHKLQLSVVNIKESPVQILFNGKILAERTMDKIKTATAKDGLSEEQVRIMYAKVGARTMWSTMYECAAVKNINIKFD